MSVLLYHRLDGFFALYIRLFSLIVSNVGSIATHAIAQLCSLSFTLPLFQWNAWIILCMNSVCFGFGKYEITAQIETFVWIFFLTTRLSCDNAVSWSQLHHNIMLVSLSFWNAHGKQTCNFAFVCTIRLSNYSIKKRMGAIGNSARNFNSHESMGCVYFSTKFSFFVTLTLFILIFQHNFLANRK